MRIIKNISFYLGLSLLANSISILLESNFLADFLRKDLMIILITLLAINTATSGLLISSIKELAKTDIDRFQKSVREIKVSIVEQISLIIFSTVALILQDSAILQSLIPYHNLIFSSLLCAAFIYSIEILWDTGMAIFMILKS